MLDSYTNEQLASFLGPVGQSIVEKQAHLRSTLTEPSAYDISHLFAAAEEDHYVRTYEDTGSEEILEAWVSSFIPKGFPVQVRGTEVQVAIPELLVRDGDPMEVLSILDLQEKLAEAGIPSLTFYKHFWHGDAFASVVSAQIELSDPNAATLAYTKFENETGERVVKRSTSGTFAEMWTILLGVTFEDFADI